MNNNFVSQTFWVTVFKTDKTFYPGGQNQLLHCNHVNQGTYAMNAEGVVTPTTGALFPSQDVPPQAGTPPVAVPAALNPQGGVYENPNQFSVQGQTQAQVMVPVPRIKDMVLLEEF